MHPRRLCCVMGALLVGCGRGSAPQDATDTTRPPDSSKAIDTAQVPSDGGDDGSATDTSVPFDVGTGTWAAVSGGEPCGLFAAAASVSLPSRAWTSCGVGCTTAPAELPGFKSPLRGTTTATASSDDFYVRLTMGGEGRRIVQVFRVSDGVTFAAVEQRSALATCVTAGQAVGAALVVPFFDAKARLFVGRLDVATRTVASWSKWVAVPGPLASTFYATNAFGGSFRDNTVRVVIGDSTTLNTIDTQPAIVPMTAAAGADVFWPALVGAGKYAVRGRRLGVSIATESYVTGADDTVMHVVALSSDRLAWIAARGPRAFEGVYSSAALMWSPLPTKPADVASVTGPAMPAAAGLTDLVVGPDYAASIGYDETGKNSTLIVVRLSTKQVWRIPPRTGNEVVSILAISSSEILVGEKTAGTASDVVHRLVRLRLSNIDDLAKV